MQFAVTILSPYLVSGGVYWDSPPIPSIVQNVENIEQAVEVVRRHLPCKVAEIQRLLDLKPGWDKGTYFEVKIAPVPENTSFVFLFGHIMGSKQTRTMMM